MTAKRKRKQPTRERRVSGHNRGYWFRKGRGWYATENGKSILLRAENGDHLKAEDTPADVLEQAYARYLLGPQEEAWRLETRPPMLRIAPADLQQCKCDQPDYLLYPGNRAGVVAPCIPSSENGPLGLPPHGGQVRQRIRTVDRRPRRRDSKGNDLEIFSRREQNPQAPHALRCPGDCRNCASTADWKVARSFVNMVRLLPLGA
jgi:hypothetical protein